MFRQFVWGKKKKKEKMDERKKKWRSCKIGREKWVKKKRLRIDLYLEFLNEIWAHIDCLWMRNNVRLSSLIWSWIDGWIGSIVERCSMNLSCRLFGWFLHSYNMLYWLELCEMCSETHLNLVGNIFVHGLHNLMLYWLSYCENCEKVSWTPVLGKSFLDLIFFV